MYIVACSLSSSGMISVVNCAGAAVGLDSRTSRSQLLGAMRVSFASSLSHLAESFLTSHDVRRPSHAMIARLVKGPPE
jgi:hypothetical protein